MKTKVSFLLIFLCLFLLTLPAFSGTWTRSTSNATFYFSGETTSESKKLAGRGSTYYQVSGYASISGTAEALQAGDEYEAVAWLETSGKDSSGVPGRGNIDTTKKDASGANYDSHSTATGEVVYKKHVVAKASNTQYNPGSYKSKSLSESSSHSYVGGSYSSPSGTSVSPYCYGRLDGNILKSAGGATLTPLTFRSEDNPASDDTPDDGKKNVVSEICQRAQNCGKPGTATSSLSHRVACPDDRWGSNVLLGAIGIWKKKKEDCPGYIWTCATPSVCPLVASHVSSSESKLEEKYVDKDGNTVDPSTVKRPCGHSVAASGDHSLQASCSTDSKCISTNFYLCQHDTHEYQKLLPCGHKEGSAGSHVKTNHRWCGHNDWYCLGAAGHNYVKCPRKADGDFCRTDPKYKGYNLPCDTSHVHTYLSDQPPKPKQVTPTTTDPKPKQVLPKDGDDDDSDDDDGGTTRVDPQVTSPCGHTHKKSAASSHREVSFNCGQHSYYACTPPSSSETNRHITQTLACGSHVGRACSASLSHLSAMSCPTQNGQSCSYGTYYQCSRHTHAYPETKKPAPQQVLPKDDSDDDDDTPPSKPDPSPQDELRACGRHYKSVGGDHRFIKVCSETNSKGQSCERTSTGYWACDPHTHKFPAAPAKRPCGHSLTSSGNHSYVSSCSVSNSNGRCTKSSGYYACSPHSHSFPSSPPVSQKVLRQCGRHYKSEGGDHRFIKVCSETNSSGQSCTRTSIGYWVCDPHTHKYPAVQKVLRRCGNHYKSEGGDHSWVSSCSVTNSSGQSCTKTTGYFSCSPHSHKYPAEMRRCGSHTKSEGGDHLYERCSGCSNGYWGCNSSSVDRHRVRTCRYGSCGQSWRRCQTDTPNCSASNRSGKRCWAQ